MDRETAEEIRRHFDVVGESLQTEIRAVVEGLEGLRESTTAEFRSVRDEIADTRAMLTLSFADLERRIRS
jgi:CYTH domain-containing protein